MTESSYWTRFWRKRLSRRRLLTGAALTGSGLAAAAVIGCQGEEGGPSGRTPSPAASPAVEVTPVWPNDGRQTFVPAPAGMTGGTLRYMGFDPVVLDRYDPHQTQFGPMYANTSAIFSKLYMYASHEEPTWENILPDLAESAPEMIGDPPDTYVIKLRRGVKFHDNENARRNFPNLAGRELTADDVIFSYERQRNRNSPQWSWYYRSSQYETIDKIEKIDDYTIRITTKGPVAPFFHFMADTNAMIIPREIVDEDKDTVDVGTGPKPAERMIGTGPFMWGELKWGIEYKAVRNPNWFGWDDPDLGRPYLDAYVASGTGLNDSTIESLLREKKVDVGGMVENPDWVYALKQEHPEMLLFWQQSSGFLNSRLKVYCKPFDDWRVRKALHLAVDRRQIQDVIYKGQGGIVGPVGNAIKLWALPQEELMTIPGYRQSTAEREEDIAEARRLYEAAGSPELPQIWFADTPSYIPQFIGTYSETLRQNLGVPAIRTLTQPYARIAEGLLRGCDQIAMGWGFDNGWIDLDDWVFPYFKSGGPKNSFQDQERRDVVFDAELDSLLDAQRREFDIERRKDLGYQIQRYLLGMDPSGSGAPLQGLENRPAVHARLDYVTPGGPTVSWPYYKNRTTFPWFGNSYWNAWVWFDRNDPSWQGRPS